MHKGVDQWYVTKILMTSMPYIVGSTELFTYIGCLPLNFGDTTTLEKSYFCYYDTRSTPPPQNTIKLDTPPISKIL